MKIYLCPNCLNVTDAGTEECSNCGCSVESMKENDVYKYDLDYDQTGFLHKAVNGNARAQASLAYCFFYEKNAKYNPREAVKWAKLSALSLDPFGLLMFGIGILDTDVEFSQNPNLWAVCMFYGAYYCEYPDSKNFLSNSFAQGKNNLNQDSLLASFINSAYCGQTKTGSAMAEEQMDQLDWLMGEGSIFERDEIEDYLAKVLPYVNLRREKAFEAKAEATESCVGLNTINVSENPDDFGNYSVDLENAYDPFFGI